MVPLMLKPIIAIAFLGENNHMSTGSGKNGRETGDFWKGRVRILADLFPNKIS